MHVCLCMPWVHVEIRWQRLGVYPFYPCGSPGLNSDFLAWLSHLSRWTCLAFGSFKESLCQHFCLEMERFVKGSWYRKQHWTQQGNGGEERHPRERQQKEVHTPDVTLVRTGKGIKNKKTRKKTKALATLHAALMHYTHYMKKTVTKTLTRPVVPNLPCTASMRFWARMYTVDHWIELSG